MRIINTTPWRVTYYTPGWACQSGVVLPSSSVTVDIPSGSGLLQCQFQSSGYDSTLPQQLEEQVACDAEVTVSTTITFEQP